MFDFFKKHKIIVICICVIVVLTFIIFTTTVARLHSRQQTALQELNKQIEERDKRLSEASDELQHASINLQERNRAFEALTNELARTNNNFEKGIAGTRNIAKEFEKILKQSIYNTESTVLGDGRTCYFFSGANNLEVNMINEEKYKLK